MRLIDADALLKKFCVNSEGRRIPEVDCDNHEITVSIKDIKRIIREQPTAYDPEAVVAELEDKFERTVAEILDKTGSDFTIADFNVKRYSDRICEIVRKGGTT